MNVAKATEKELDESLYRIKLQELQKKIINLEKCQSINREEFLNIWKKIYKEKAKNVKSFNYDEINSSFINLYNLKKCKEAFEKFKESSSQITNTDNKCELNVTEDSLNNILKKLESDLKCNLNINKVGTSSDNYQSIELYSGKTVIGKYWISLCASNRVYDSRINVCEIFRGKGVSYYLYGSLLINKCIKEIQLGLQEDNLNLFYEKLGENKNFIEALKFTPVFKVLTKYGFRLNIEKMNQIECNQYYIDGIELIRD